MAMHFAKMHGAGNDFIMVDDRDGSFPGDGRRIAALAARRTGIGSEGVILIQKSARADFRGNVMCFETLAGLVDAEVVSSTLVKVWMPDPTGLKDNFVNSGVPHKIVPVANLAQTDVDGEGRRIRLSDEFAPGGTNVDFVTYRSPNRVSMRTYERGVEAESGACGTGAVAAAVVGVAQHGLKFPVKVKTASGYELVVDGEFANGVFRSITLTGPVKKVFAGEIDLDTLDDIDE